MLAGVETLPPRRQPVVAQADVAARQRAARKPREDRVCGIRPPVVPHLRQHRERVGHGLVGITPAALRDPAPAPVDERQAEADRAAAQGHPGTNHPLLGEPGGAAAGHVEQIAGVLHQ